MTDRFGRTITMTEEGGKFVFRCCNGEHVAAKVTHTTPDAMRRVLNLFNSLTPEGWVEPEDNDPEDNDPVDNG
jgi:hypothetical protein